MEPSSIKKSLAFDDVLIRPAKSEVLPNEVKTSLQLTKNIRLEIPLLSFSLFSQIDSNVDKPSSMKDLCSYFLFTLPTGAYKGIPSAGISGRGGGDLYLKGLNLV